MYIFHQLQLNLLCYLTVLPVHTVSDLFQIHMIIQIEILA